MLIEELIRSIEAVAPPEAQAAWDLSGLQVATSRKEATLLAIFLDPTPENINKGLAGKADFLLSHHPLTLRPALPNRLDSWHESLRLLLCADVPLYAAHTSLDVNFHGPASWLAHDLSLEDMEILEPIGRHEGCLGYGGTGNLPVAQEFSELCKTIMRMTGVPSARLCGSTPGQQIRRIAWCGGSGASLISCAEKMGAQLFISGDIKYHDALEARIPVLDVGHHGYEEKMMLRFSELLRQSLPQLKIIFIPSDSPFREVH